MRASLYGLLDAIEASTVVPQNLTLARRANAVKLQKCLDGARIGRVVVRPIGRNDDVLITHGRNGVPHDRLIWINRDIATTAPSYSSPPERRRSVPENVRKLRPSTYSPMPASSPLDGPRRAP